jgi:hypothetical protein
MTDKLKAKQVKETPRNREGRIFWSTFQKRLDKLIEERPQVVSDALADMEDEARRRGFRQTPSLEYFIERVSKRKLSPKKRGRPKDNSAQRADLRKRIAELKQKHSWSKMPHRMADEGIYLSVGTARRILAK